MDSLDDTTEPNQKSFGLAEESAAEKLIDSGRLLLQIRDGAFAHLNFRRVVAGLGITLDQANGLIAAGFRDPEQLWDAYLAELADRRRRRSGLLATIDQISRKQGIKGSFPEELIGYDISFDSWLDEFWPGLASTQFHIGVLHALLQYLTRGVIERHLSFFREAIEERAAEERSKKPKCLKDLLKRSLT